MKILCFKPVVIALVLSFFQFAANISSAQTQNLETETLEIITTRGSFQFSVEIADEPEERTIGLMNRVEMEPRGGMLFAFDQPRLISMWMKNTLISLDMIFVNIDGTVKKIAARTTPHSLEIVSSGTSVPFVLELNAGMAAFIGLSPGDQLKHRLFKAKSQ